MARICFQHAISLTCYSMVSFRKDHFRFRQEKEVELKSLSTEVLKNSLVKNPSCGLQANVTQTCSYVRVRAYVRARVHECAYAPHMCTSVFFDCFSSVLDLIPVFLL